MDRCPSRSELWSTSSFARPLRGQESAAHAGYGVEWLFRIRRHQAQGDFGAGKTPFRRTAAMARLEAALLVADGPLSVRRLVQCAMLADVPETRKLIDQLNLAYDQTRSVFRIERVATGYRLLTRPKFAAWLDRLHQRQAELRLSPPAMETLCIIAYRQPVTRADIEAVRGVQSSEMIRQLMERNLVRITGEDDTLGRPYLYGTTRGFLEMFGITVLDELPMAKLLRPQTLAAATVVGDPEGDEVTASEPPRDAAEAA